MGDTIDLMIKAITTFYDDLKADGNDRYRSWEHCYKSFHVARNIRNADYDYLSLQLAFYLASWGMYRGSSFLLQKDYKIHIPVIEEILKDEYDCLLGIECKGYRKEDVQKRLDKLYSYMENYYDGVRNSVKSETKNKLSMTLITKILMGTLGCVPAYDRYFIKGVKDQNVTTGYYGKNSLAGLVDFYEKNNERLEQVRNNLKMEDDLIYPQMKLLDMGFWQIGLEKEKMRG